MPTSPIRRRRPCLGARETILFSGGLLLGFFLSSILFLAGSSHKHDCQQPFPDLLAHNQPVSNHHQLHNDQGWKQVHVFFGNSSHIADASTIPNPYFRENKWFSQYRQDEVVSKLLREKRNGYFVDLAANDAIRISNTYALETNFDWNGLCIEPNPVYWGGLSYRKCEVVGAVVGNQSMQEVKFRFQNAKGPKGGILGEEFDNKEDKYNEGQRRFTTKLLDLFQRFNVPSVIDYMSLDIEGAADLVLSAFPFSEYRFNVLTVERPSSMISQRLTSNGYQLLATLKKQETLWIHSTMLETIDRKALEIDSQHYRYRESVARARITPEEDRS